MQRIMRVLYYGNRCNHLDLWFWQLWYDVLGLGSQRHSKACWFFLYVVLANFVSLPDKIHFKEVGSLVVLEIMFSTISFLLFLQEKNIYSKLKSNDMSRYMTYAHLNILFRHKRSFPSINLLILSMFSPFEYFEGRLG